jgi:hypothetical protein
VSRIFNSDGGDLRDDAPPVLDSLAYKEEHPSTPMNTFLHCHSRYQTEPPAACQLEACRAEPSPEGGCPSRSAAAGANSRGGAPPEDAPTAVEDCLSRLCVASFPLSVSATLSEQNEFLSTSRLHRSRQFVKWGPIGRGGAGRAVGYGVASPAPCLAGARWGRRLPDRPIGEERRRSEPEVTIRQVRS